MEDNRDRIIVIAAGYPNDMRRFVAANPGLEGRFTRTIDFPAYEPDELIAILRSMARQGGYVLPDDLETKLRPWLESSAKRENWANAREMRTLLEHARDAQAVRISADSTANLDPDDLKRLEMTDFESVIGPVQTNVEVLEKRRLTVESKVEQARGLDQALGDLEAMIGLGSVKNEVNKLLASLEVEKKRREQGLPVAPTSRHMVFTGPPGVGKTVVAGVLGDIYRSLGVLRKGHFVPVERSDLVAGYVGQTASKTLEKCKEALDGILFIDEAYSLVQQSGASWDFGREAIDTLLKFMEDNRDRIIVIAAGYPNDMRRFVAANQGLQSRFTKTIDFPAFSTEELLTIFRSMAGKAGYQLPDDSLVQVRSWIESRRKDEAWGNARSIRTLLEAAREAQAMRISGDPSADLVRIEPGDIEAAIAAQA
jgi:DNA polymerase III delta prime subunit